jgi:hypothetical protein
VLDASRAWSLAVPKIGSAHLKGQHGCELEQELPASRIAPLSQSRTVKLSVQYPRWACLQRSGSPHCQSTNSPMSVSIAMRIVSVRSYARNGRLDGPSRSGSPTAPTQEVPDWYSDPRRRASTGGTDRLLSGLGENRASKDRNAHQAAVARNSDQTEATVRQRPVLSADRFAGGELRRCGAR